MIPRKIHYCWFGKAPFPKLVKQAMDTWKTHLKGYEFVLWNENNSDLSHPFAKYAYENKKWAFVSDIVRLQVLQKYGGIYLDTDMYIIRPLDDLLEQRCFIGAENVDLISCGIIGAVPGHPLISESLKYYSAHPLTEKYFRLAIPRVITRAAEKIYPRQLGEFNKEVIIPGDLSIYPATYFYPLPFAKDKPLPTNFIDYATEETYAIHLWAGSWMQYSEFQHIRRGEYLKGLSTVFKNMNKKSFSISYLRKLLASFKSSFKRNG